MFSKTIGSWQKWDYKDRTLEFLLKFLDRVFTQRLKLQSLSVAKITKKAYKGQGK